MTDFPGWDEKTSQESESLQKPEETAGRKKGGGRKETGSKEETVRTEEKDSTREAYNPADSIEKTSSAEKNGSIEEAGRVKAAGSIKKSGYRSGGDDGGEERERIREIKSNSFWKGVLTGSLCMLVFCGIYLVILVRLSDTGGGLEESRGAEVLTESGTLDKLAEVGSLIDAFYLGDLDSEELSASLFRGVAAGLEDVYARYYTEEELNTALDETQGAYYGIGATLIQNMETGEIRATQIYEGSPAQKAGLQPGDVLLACGGEDLQSMELSDAVACIKAQEGEFELIVYREETEEELTLTIQCEEVEKTTVHIRMLGGTVGYMEILEFDQVTVEQFRSGLSELKEQGMEKLIVDLRGNPGGLLDSVCEIMDDLLPEGLIVYTEDKSGNCVEYNSEEGQLFDGELAVLVDQDTASAAEIFAGAVQDHEIGTIIGTQTYGKGLVQKTYTLSDGSGIKFTTENYFTPLGNNINGTGITPDIVLEEESEDETEEQTEEIQAEETERAEEEPDAALDAALALFGE